MEYQKITKVSKNSLNNNSETVTNENDKEIPKKRYISLEERQKIIDNLIKQYQSLYHAIFCQKLFF